MLRKRIYRNDDFQLVCSFLGRLYQINRNRPYWLPARWEYAAYLVSPLYLHRGHPDWKETIRIWETDTGEIVAIVNSENPDENAFLHTHTDHRYLEEEMVLWAEETISIAKGNTETKQLTIWTLEDDDFRERILSKRGYEKQNVREYLKWQFLNNQVPDVTLPEGFSITSISDGANIASKIECAAKAFKSSEVPTDVYKFMQTAPSYRSDLDLCTVRGDGTITSFCTVWLDIQNNIGYFEPVGTHPEYQRRGLGKAVLTEGLTRLKRLGVEIAYVGAYGENRSAFYTSAGFTNFTAMQPWKKAI